MSIGITAAPWDFGPIPIWTVTQESKQAPEDGVDYSRRKARKLPALRDPGRLSWEIVGLPKAQWKDEVRFPAKLFQTHHVRCCRWSRLSDGQGEGQGRWATHCWDFKIFEERHTDVVSWLNHRIDGLPPFVIFHYLSMTRVCPIFLWLNHVKSHYFIVNCQFLMVIMAIFAVWAPRYFTATWDDQLPMEINKIFPRNGERPMPRVSWREQEVLIPGREIGGLSSYPNNYRWLMMLSKYIYIYMKNVCKYLLYDLYKLW